MLKKKIRWLILILILLLASCKSEKYNEIELSQVENIEEYLVLNIGISGFGKDVFCTYEPLNAEQGADNKIYLWVMCLEYYLKEDILTLGSGVSLPVVLYIQQKNEYYEIVQQITPRDGTYYGSDVRDNFPKSTWIQIFPESAEEKNDYNHRAEKLEQDLEKKAKNYYGN